MSLNCKEKSLCQPATTGLFPNDTGKHRHLNARVDAMTKARLGLMP